LAKELALPEAAVDLAQSDGVAVGYASWRRGVGEVELLRVAVLPEHRRNGVAAALLHHGLGAPATRSSERVHLEVREGNLAARALYERVGFEVVGRRRGYYPNGETAVLYSLGVPK
jgi:ribosomal-protein-alanine N-acetyltransferase